MGQRQQELDNKLKSEENQMEMKNKRKKKEIGGRART
jgi:hypothetical protein